MKKFFQFICLGLIGFQSLSASWQDEWAEALKCVEEKRFAEAEQYFERALSSDGASDSIYIDLGNLLNRLGRYQEADIWLSHAIEKGQLSKDDIWKAYGERTIARIGINPEDERALEDIKVFAELSPFVPKKINGEKKIILKSVPSCPCYEKVMTCLYIHSGQCNSKDDILKMSNGDWIINKSYDCGCKPESEPKICDACGADLTCGTKENEDDCKKYCTLVGVFAYDWCGKAFASSAPCRWVCLATVYELSDLCWFCCEEGNWKSTCAKPLREIKNAMAEACSAEIRDTWDD